MSSVALEELCQVRENDVVRLILQMCNRKTALQTGEHGVKKDVGFQHRKGVVYQKDDIIVLWEM